MPTIYQQSNTAVVTLPKDSTYVALASVSILTTWGIAPVQCQPRRSTVEHRRQRKIVEIAVFFKDRAFTPGVHLY